MLEYVRARGEEWTAYEGEAWYGSTYNRAVIKAEGEVARGKLHESETQLLWRHAVSTFWDTELGLRFDHGQGVPNREWLARSEEHTSELQSLMRISYAVFCLKQKNHTPYDTR